MNHHKRFKNELITLCEQFADKAAITYMREEGANTYTTYKEILAGCIEIKEILDGVGITAGDRVAIVSPHSPQAVLASLGLEYSNVTTVLIDASLPESEINRLLAFADVRGLFVTEKLYSCIEQNNKKDIPVFQLCKEERKYTLFEDSVRKVSKGKTVDSETDVMAILFSSGTTAQMKGIKVTYKSVMTASKIFVRNVAWKATYKYLHVFPLNHIAGYATVHAFLSCGSELGMIENMTSSKLLEALLAYEPDGFGMIPKVFEMMEDKIRETIRQKGKNIRTIGTGASLCRASTSKFFIDLGLNWANFYASTETNVPAVSTGIFDRYPVLMAGNVERNPEIEVCIHNPDSEGIGEIYIKGELLMKGYFKDDELTESSFDGDYFKTGDYGYVDKKNNLYVTGRVKESILLHNGKKVSPTDIENYYKKRIPQVEMACCGCAKENTTYDEVYMFVEAADKKREEIVEIMSNLREESANANYLYKLDYIKVIEKLPLTSVGKVKRFELPKCVLPEWNLPDSEEHKETKDNGVEETVIRLICRISGKDEKLRTDLRIKEDLGFDSLNIFELQTQIEMCYGAKLMEDWEHIFTIQDLINHIKIKGNSKDRKEVYDSECYLSNRSSNDVKRIKHLTWVFNSICKVKYKGIENLTNEPCIFAANHSSHLDIMCVYKAIVLRYGYEKIYKMCCLAAKELVLQRGMKKTFHALGAIPVDRKGNAAMALVTLNKYIQEKGYSAVVFPEGTRTRSGKIGRFTNGVASSAITTNVPVIPIGIVGSYDIWPATRKKPYFSLKRRTVTVTIGKPIYPTISDVSKLTEIIKDNVQELCEEA